MVKPLKFQPDAPSVRDIELLVANAVMEVRICHTRMTLKHCSQHTVLVRNCRV